MVRLLQRVAPVLHLTRISTAFALVANTWFVILWTRANGAFEGQAAGPPNRLLDYLLGCGSAQSIFGFTPA